MKSLLDFILYYFHMEAYRKVEESEALPCNLYVKALVNMQFRHNSQYSL